jgi:hypothetical protein
MSNVITFARSSQKHLQAASAALDDDELNLRRWELIMSGQRDSQEFRELDSEFAGRRAYVASRGAET